MELPVIINIDSQYDWTSEVQDIWDTIDCKNLHQNFPKIDESYFDFRLTKKLVTIGLCSPSFIDHSYNKKGNCNETEENTDSWIHREEENWRAVQVGQESNVSHFNGEEPHFRQPKICENYIIEPYGIYTDDCTIFLSDVVDMDKLPLGAKGGAGIFLCPERIVKIYPTLLEGLKNPKHPIPLTSNPILTNLKIILLHELGHHIFPVHRNCKGKKYISEGLANYFCYSNLTDIERAWLLYKSRTLQPPEYSSYRFISILHRYYNQKIDDVFTKAFEGSTDGWETIFKKTITQEGYTRDWADLIERQTEHLTTAITLDFLPTVGFLHDFDELLGNEKKWRWDIDHGKLHLHHRHDYKKQINPDFIWDLYNDFSIFPWVLSTEIPDEIWSSWGMSTSHGNMGTDSKLPGKLSWPEGPLFRMTTRQDWKRVITESPYQWARNAAMVWLLDAMKNKSDVENFLCGFSLSDNPPTNCGAVIEVFNKYSKQLNSTAKAEIISILQRFIREMETNRSIRIDTEKLIKKLKSNNE